MSDKPKPSIQDFTYLIKSGNKEEFEKLVTDNIGNLNNHDKVNIMYEVASTSNDIGFYQILARNGIDMKFALIPLLQNVNGHRKFDVVKYLVDTNPDVLKPVDLVILRYLAYTQIVKDDIDAIKTLDYIVDKGYNVRAVDVNKNNILHVIANSVDNPSPTVLKRFVELGVSRSQKNYDGNTALNVYLNRVGNNADPLIVQILMNPKHSNILLLSKLSDANNHVDAGNHDAETRKLIKSFFINLKSFQYDINTDPCTLLWDVLMDIKGSWIVRFKGESKELLNILLRDKEDGIINAFKAYTTPKTFRYINQYFRTRKTVNDINAMYKRQRHSDYVLKGFTNQNMLEHAHNIEKYYQSYPNSFKVTTDDVYLLRGADVKSLGLQLNKSILVQGYTSTTPTDSIAKDFLNDKNDCCMMILHVMPGVTYAPIAKISDATFEHEILLQNNVFFTLRGSIDCRKDQSFIFALVDVSNNVIEFDIDATDSYHYQPQSGICYKISPKLYEAFLSAVQYDLENLDGSVIREICRSLDLKTSGNKYDLVMSIRHVFNTSPNPGIDCIPERFETLFCALMGSKAGCLRDDYKHESIIATMSSEPGTKRRKLHE